VHWVELDWLEDAELLGRIGRKPLAGILDLLAPFLARQNLALPDPSLPDHCYFAQLAAMVRTQPIKVAVYLPPFLAAGAEAQAPKPAAAGTPMPRRRNQPPYALHHDGALWHLTFDGHPAVLRHEQGICYVAHLFASPGERVKNLFLATRCAPLSRNKAAITEAWDDRKGEAVPLARQPIVQAAVTAEDEKEARRRLLKLAQELREAIKDPTTPETEKVQARQDLEDIASSLRKDSRPSRDECKKAADSVRGAIKHLLRTLLQRGGRDASEEQARRELARHIEQHLVTPSRRYAAPGAGEARGELTGCLLYEPPAGVSWVVRQ
jgi:hypothetical protein